MDLQLWWTDWKGRKNFKRKIELIVAKSDSDGVFWFGRKLRFCGAEFQQGVSKFEKDGRAEIGRRWFNKDRKSREKSKENEGELSWKKEF